jgi:hypothetical protein
MLNIFFNMFILNFQEHGAEADVLKSEGNTGHVHPIEKIKLLQKAMHKTW